MDKKKPSLNYLNSENKSKIESKSDFDINLKKYKRSNIKINNTENIFTKNKMLVMCFLIIKYLLISSISCNNKGSYFDEINFDFNSYLINWIHIFYINTFSIIYILRIWNYFLVKRISFLINFITNRKFL